MKTSKMDQIRALREVANSTAKSVIRKAGVTPDPRLQPAASYLSKNVFDGTRPLTADHAARLGAVPLLAREGKCASCDRRRTLLTAAKAKRRAKTP